MKVFSDGFILSLKQEHSLSLGDYREASSKIKKNKKNPCLRRKCQKRTTLEFLLCRLAMMLLYSRLELVKTVL